MNFNTPTSLSSIIYNKKLLDKVPSFDKTGKARPERHWCIQPDQIFNSQEVEHQKGLDSYKVGQSLPGVEVTSLIYTPSWANTLLDGAEQGNSIQLSRLEMRRRNTWPWCAGQRLSSGGQSGISDCQRVQKWPEDPSNNKCVFGGTQLQKLLFLHSLDHQNQRAVAYHRRAQGHCVELLLQGLTSRN